MTRKLDMAWALCAVLAACGCGADHLASSEPGGGDELASFRGRDEVLHSMSIPGQRIDFIHFELEGAAAEGPPSLQIRSLFDAGQQDVVATLFQAYGALTSLEVFQAVASSDVAPHDLLLASHAHEAEALGRTSDAVREVTLAAADAVLETRATAKALPVDAASLCRASNFTTDSTGVWTRVNLQTATLAPAEDGQGAFVCAGGPGGATTSLRDVTCPNFFNQPLRLAFCHLDNDGAPFAIQLITANEGLPVESFSPQVIQPGQNFATTFGAGSEKKSAGLLAFAPSRRTGSVLGSGVAEPP